MHEYGGRPFTARDGVVVGVEFADQRLYRLEPGGSPLPLTPESGGALRYADLVLDLPRGRVLAVREDHRGDGEPVNTLVAVPLDGRRRTRARCWPQGHDFFAYPRLSPDGHAAGLAELGPSRHAVGQQPALARRARRRRAPAGADRDRAGAEESLVQPEWSPAGELHVVSDRSDFWSLYRVAGAAWSRWP